MVPLLSISYTVYYEALDGVTESDQNVTADMIVGSSFGEHSIWVGHSSVTLMPKSDGYIDYDVSLSHTSHVTYSYFISTIHCNTARLIILFSIQSMILYILLL